MESWLHGARIQTVALAQSALDLDVDQLVLDAVRRMDEGPLRLRQLAATIDYLGRRCFDGGPPIAIPDNWWQSEANGADRT
jgi:hypothetical protein